MNKQDFITDAKFLCSSPELKFCPKPDKAEFAFIGRSNVGKSSLINMLTRKKKMALTSSTPGKTQMINHFVINDNWYLTDLPGYGYAKVSKGKRYGFSSMIESYLRSRKNLMITFVLVDARHEPQKKDMEFIRWMAENELPFALIFTKSDKLGKNALSEKIKDYSKELLKEWDELPLAFVTSAMDSRGREEVLSFIEQNIEDFNPNFI